MPGNLFRKNLRGDSNIRQRIQQILWLLDTMAMPSRIHLHHSYVYAPRCFEKPIQLFFGFLTRFRVIRFTRSKRPRRRLNVSPLIRRIDSTFNNGNAVKKNRVNVEFFAGFLENTSLNVERSGRRTCAQSKTQCLRPIVLHLMVYRLSGLLLRT